MSLPKFPGFIPDFDDADSIDDLYWPGVDLRIERMDRGYYWIGVTAPDGTLVHIDLVGEPPTTHPRTRPRLRARIRKP